MKPEIRALLVDCREHLLRSYNERQRDMVLKTIRGIDASIAQDETAAAPPEGKEEDATPETDSIMKTLRKMLNERGERRIALQDAIECAIENLERDRNRLQRENAELRRENHLWHERRDAAWRCEEEARNELAAKDAEIAALKVSFRVNMLRLAPGMPHEEIDAVINAARAEQVSG